MTQTVEQNEQMILNNELNSAFLCWKVVGTHNCTFNNSLRMDFGWLMDTQEMTLFSKKRPNNLREAEPLLHIHQFFPLQWTKHAFLKLLF